MGEYIYYKHWDSPYFDLEYYPNHSIEELKHVCDENENAIGFNNLGYIKKKIINPIFMTLPNILNYDGLYVRKDLYEKQNIRCKMMCN